MRSSLLLVRIALVVCVMAAIFPATAIADAVIADHTVIVQFPDISPPAIETIKQDFRLFYGHTSHGSQIVTGMTMIRDENSLYDFNNGDGTLSLTEYGSDLGNAEDTAWVAVTRAALNEPGNTFNVVVWSWCGQVSWATEEGINTYLGAMNQLEQEYPDVHFIYMTGHLDGTGPTGNLYLRNNQIRAYCAANDKILFDFADIESYDPDGVYYPDETDYCNWCTSWCASHDCPTCYDCAHSQCFNCYRKGKAFWWLLNSVRTSLIPHASIMWSTPPYYPVPPSTSIDVKFSCPMDPTTINAGTLVVNGTITGKHQGTITYDEQEYVAEFVPSQPFAPGEVITVVVTTGMTSDLGVHLFYSSTRSFTIAASGAGGGGFVVDSTYAVGSYPKEIIATDVNGDGSVDLVTGNLGPETITVLRNDEAGVFARAGDYYAYFNPVALAGADFNSDWNTDIAVVGEDGEYMVHVSVLANDGEGVFASPVNYYGGSFAYDICAADFNNDGFMDVARSSNGDIAVYFGAADGSLALAATMPNISAGALCAADFDNDQYVDLAGALGFGDSIVVIFNTGNGTFNSSPRKIAVGNNALDIVAGNFVSDDPNYVDLAVVNGLDKTVTILVNNHYSDFDVWQVVDVPDGPNSICAGDFNGDGRTDIVTTNRDSGTVSVILNSPNDVFGLVDNPEVGGQPYSAACGDFDGDGDLDLAVTDFSGTGNVTVLANLNQGYRRGDANDDGSINTGDAVYIISYIFRDGPPPPHLEAADPNCDSRITVGDAVFIVAYIFRGGPPPCFP